MPVVRTNLPDKMILDAKRYDFKCGDTYMVAITIQTGFPIPENSFRFFGIYYYRTFLDPQEYHPNIKKRAGHLPMLPNVEHPPDVQFFLGWLEGAMTKIWFKQKARDKQRTLTR